jgi:tetratricopeptide (TPR) repeat protein
MFEEAVAMLREIGDRLSVPYGLNNLGLVAQMQGDYRGARALYEEALASFHEIEDRAGVALCLDNLGRLSRVEGNGQLALENLWEALSLSRDLGLKSIAIDCVEVLAGLIGERGDGARAARLLGAAEALQEVVGLPHEAPEKPDYDRDVSLVRGLLDEDAFARAWDEGRGMTLEQATAYALEADDDPGAGGTVSEPDA